MILQHSLSYTAYVFLEVVSHSIIHEYLDI